MELRRAAKGWRAAGIVIIAAILVAIPALATKQTAKHTPPVTKTAAVPDEYIVKAIGSKSAPVTMEVFSDYQCPSCGSLYEQTLKPLIAAHPVPPGFDVQEVIRLCSCCAAVVRPDVT